VRHRGIAVAGHAQPCSSCWAPIPGAGPQLRGVHDRIGESAYVRRRGSRKYATSWGAPGAGSTPPMRRHRSSTMSCNASLKDSVWNTGRLQQLVSLDEHRPRTRLLWGGYTWQYWRATGRLRSSSMSYQFFGVGKGSRGPRTRAPGRGRHSPSASSGSLKWGRNRPASKAPTARGRGDTGANLDWRNEDTRYAPAMGLYQRLIDRFHSLPPRCLDQSSCDPSASNKRLRWRWSETASLNMDRSALAMRIARVLLAPALARAPRAGKGPVTVPVFAFEQTAVWLVDRVGGLAGRKTQPGPPGYHNLKGTPRLRSLPCSFRTAARFRCVGSTRPKGEERGTGPGRQPNAGYSGLHRP